MSGKQMPANRPTAAVRRPRPSSRCSCPFTTNAGRSARSWAACWPSPVGIQIELVIVDDASSDGSWEVIQELAAADPRIKAVRHPHNRGKGAAVRTAISRCTGDVAVVQDADLEYDPREYARLLEPIRQGRADAVFGSRFSGDNRRVMFFWHAAVNKLLTLLSNMVNNLDLSDMEVCYKMIRCDVLKRLRLRSDRLHLRAGSDLPPGPVGRPGVRGARQLRRPQLRGGEEDPGPRRTAGHRRDHPLQVLRSAIHRSRRVIRARSRWPARAATTAGPLEPGPHPILAGGFWRRGRASATSAACCWAANGWCWPSPIPSSWPTCCGSGSPREQRAHRSGRSDPTRPTSARGRPKNSIPSLCSNVLEHLEGRRGSARPLLPDHRAGRTLRRGSAGRPAALHALDRARGNCRRYTPAEAVRKMTAAGFEVVHTRRFGRLAAIGWALAGHVLRSRGLTPRQMLWSDRLMPLARTWSGSCRCRARRC